MEKGKGREWKVREVRCRGHYQTRGRKAKMFFFFPCESLLFKFSTSDLEDLSLLQVKDKIVYIA